MATPLLSRFWHVFYQTQQTLKNIGLPQPTQSLIPSWRHALCNHNARPESLHVVQKGTSSWDRTPTFSEGLLRRLQARGRCPDEEADETHLQSNVKTKHPSLTWWHEVCTCALAHPHAANTSRSASCNWSSEPSESVWAMYIYVYICIHIYTCKCIYICIYIYSHLRFMWKMSMVYVYVRVFEGSADARWFWHGLDRVPQVLKNVRLLQQTQSLIQFWRYACGNHSVRLESFLDAHYGCGEHAFRIESNFEFVVATLYFCSVYRILLRHMSKPTWQRCCHHLHIHIHTNIHICYLNSMDAPICICICLRICIYICICIRRCNQRVHDPSEAFLEVLVASGWAKAQVRTSCHHVSEWHSVLTGLCRCVSTASSFGQPPPVCKRLSRPQPDACLIPRAGPFRHASFLHAHYDCGKMWEPYLQDWTIAVCRSNPACFSICWALQQKNDKPSDSGAAMAYIYIHAYTSFKQIAGVTTCIYIYIYICLRICICICIRRCICICICICRCI